jgi:glycosyltransferase involved in cell wall biosynthesis
VTGAAAGWTVAIAVEGAAMVPMIRRALRQARVQRRPGGPVRRVLMVTPRYHPFTGGIETHVHELATRLVARGVEVRVLTTDPTGRLPERERADGIEIRRCPAWGWLGDLAFAPSLPGALAAEDADVVHLQGVHTLVAPLALLALRGRRAPLVVSFHSGGHTSRLRTALRPLQWWLLRPGLAAAEGLVAVGEFEAALFARALGVPRARISVIPNGFELPPPAGPPAPDPDASPLLVSIGRLERYKGHHRVIRALETVLRAYPRAQLQVVGTGPYERPLRRLAADLAVADRVRFASFAPGERAELRRLLERADLVALLSEYEAHPVAAAEAAGLGRRVLVADNSGLRELAGRGLASAVSLRRSDQELGQAMVELLGSPPPPRPEALASWDACADLHLELYRCVSSC